MKRFAIEIVGRSPLLMNRYAGEQPSTKKIPPGKKTQAHIDAYRLKDWLRAAYYQDGRGWFIPPENLEKMMSSGATKFCKGKDFKWAVAVESDFTPLLLPDGQGRYAPACKPLMDYYPEYADVRGGGSQRKARGSLQAYLSTVGTRF